MEYNPSYSLTVEETDKMYEWEKKHNKKFHKKGFGYQGAIGISNFEVRFVSCSIGVWCECVCLNCLEKMKNCDERMLKKLKKNSSYTIKELD